MTSFQRRAASVSLGFALASLILGLIPLFILFLTGVIPSYDLPISDLTINRIDIRVIQAVSFFNFFYSSLALFTSRKLYCRLQVKHSFPYGKLVLFSYIIALLNILLVLVAVNMGLTSDTHWTNIRGEYNPFYSIIDLTTKVSISLPSIQKIYTVCVDRTISKKLASYHGCFIPPILLVLSTGNRIFLLIPMILFMLLLLGRAKKNLPASLILIPFVVFAILILSHAYSIIRAKMYFAKDIFDLSDIIANAIMYRLDTSSTAFDFLHPALESSSLIIMNSLVKSFNGFDETYLFSFVLRPLSIILPEIKPDIVSPAKIAAIHIGLSDVFLNPTLPGELLLNGFFEGLLILLLTELLIQRASIELSSQLRYIFQLSMVPIAFFTYRFDYSYLLYSSILCFTVLFGVDVGRMIRKSLR